MIAHPVRQETKVCRHEREALVVRHVVSGVGILIEAIKTAFLTETSEDFAAVTAPAESRIDVNAVGTQVEAVDGLVEQYRDVVGGTKSGHVV